MVWHNWHNENYGNAKVVPCVMSQCKPESYHISRPAIVELALGKKQPMMESHCVGLVYSYDLAIPRWITVPCDMPFDAAFVCEALPTRTTLISADVNSAFQLTLTNGSKVSLRRPTLSCPYPWLAGEEMCVLPVPFKRNSTVSLDQLIAHCTTVNASLFYMPQTYEKKHIFHGGLDKTGNIYGTFRKAMYLHSDHLSLFMGYERPGKCMLYIKGSKNLFVHDCSLNKTAPNSHVACVKTFAMTNTKIPISAFMCKDGMLIAQVFVCDGVKQCLKGEDEENCKIYSVASRNCSPFSLSSHQDDYCSSLCPDLFIACVNGQCIPYDALCNNYQDCEDGWDEVDCVHGGFPMIKQKYEDKSDKDKDTFIGQQEFVDEFECTDVEIYSNVGICMFDLDEWGNWLYCKDGSHLERCHQVGCPNAYKCFESYCIPVRRVCDGLGDCPRGEDEQGCEHYMCPDLLQCRGNRGVCVPPWEVCDGTVHCKDFGEDEIYCFPCPPGMFCVGNAAMCASDASKFTPQNIQIGHLKAFICRNSSIDLVTLSYDNIIYLDIQHIKLSDDDMKQILVKAPKLLYLKAMNTSLENIMVDEKVYTRFGYVEPSF